MQEQNWKQSLESTSESTEVPADIVSTELLDTPESEPAVAASSKSHLTELRRRIEERLDSKRIAMEYDWDELDDV